MSNNPYIGPRTFEEKDAELFFGREREARELLSLVISEPLVLFYAQSGAGKSSLINTRLIPSLREERFTVLPVSRVGGALPEGIEEVDNIFVFNLLLSIDQNRCKAHELAHITISEYLSTKFFDDDDLSSDEDDLDEEDEDEDDENSGFVLIIDQFEEILTTHIDRWAEREQFFKQLRDALQNDSFLWVVLSMREDHVGPLAPYTRFLPGKLRARFHMQRMKANPAKQAIEKPAKQGGRAFAPGVAKALVDNLRQLSTYEGETHLGEFVEPVQLQVVCYQLWENLKDRPLAEITKQDLDELGNVDLALAQFYEEAIARVLANTTSSDLELRNWFEHQLITEAQTRGTVYLGVEQTAGLSNEAVYSLENQYLLRSERRAGGVWYELVHDRLINPILNANREWRLMQNPLIPAAEAWRRSGHNQDKLYTQRQLNNLPTDLNRASLAPLVQEFLKESEEDVAQQLAIRDAEAKAARRLRRLVVMAGVMCVFAILSTIVIALALKTALNATQRAERQTRLTLSQSLSARADRLVERVENIELATLLAVQAYRFNQNDAGNVHNLNDRALRKILTIDNFNYSSSDYQWIWSVAFSPNSADDPQGSRFFAAASANGHIHVWDRVQSESLPTELSGHQSDVLSLAFSPDGQMLASGSKDKSIRLWNPYDENQNENQNEEAIVLPGHQNGVWAVAFSPDGEQLASGSSDHTVRLWDLSTSPISSVTLEGHTGSVMDVDFSPDGKLLASAGDDGTIRLWNLSEKEPMSPLVLPAHNGWVTEVAFSPDGQTLASASNDGTLKLWNLNDEAAVEPIMLSGNDKNAWFLTLDFSPDGKSLIAAGTDKIVYQWNLSGEPLEPLVGSEEPEEPEEQESQTTSKYDRTLLYQHEGWVWSVAFNANSNWLASGDSNGQIRWWSFEEASGKPETIESQEPIVDAKLAHSQDNLPALLVTLGENGKPTLWADILSEARYRCSDELIQRLQERSSDLQAAAFSPTAGARRLAISNGQGNVKIFEIHANRPNPSCEIKELNSFDHGEMEILDLSFSPNGQILAVVTSEDQIYLWDTLYPNRKPIQLSGHSSVVSALSFSPDGYWFATSSEDQRIRIWQLPELNDQNEYDLRGQTFPVQECIADETHQLSTHNAQILAIEFSPDKKWFASATDNGIIRLWSSDKNEKESLCQGPPNVILNENDEPVSSIAFSQSGNMFASAGEEGLLHLWEIENLSAEPIELTTEKESIPDTSAIMFSADEQTIISTHIDGSIQLWPTLERLAELGCDQVYRNLTRSEWDYYIGDEHPYEATCKRWPSSTEIVSEHDQ